MLLNEFALCHYLLENGFLNRQQVVDEQVRICGHFSRNRNFKVSLNDTAGFLVKQPKLPFYLKKSALKKEADIYWLANNDADYSSLLNFIPQFFHYDPIVQVLITELLEPAVNLQHYHSSTNEYPETVAIQQAEILAAIHRVTSKQVENKKSKNLFEFQSNWLFNVANGDGWWGGKKTAADLELIRIVKSTVDFVELIKAAKDKWETKCLLHNDIRWTNFLMKENEPGLIKLFLIDWELSDFGDPCWDIAGILQDYFSCWILNQQADPFQLLKMKPAIAAFSNSYTEFMQLSNDDKHTMFQKSMEYTAVRMVQSCIEHVSFHNNLDEKTIRLLQCALNILKDPKQAYYDFIATKKISV